MVASEEYLQTLDETQISSLTDVQEKIVSLAGIIPSILSILGSTSIICLVIKNNKRTPYRRLMFAMACGDILSSIGWALQPFLTPSDKSQWIWSIGNDATCTVLGTIAQFAVTAQWYSGILSFYFLATVKYGVKPKKMEMYEPYIHAIVLLWNGVTAIVGAAIGLYGPVSIGPGCWVKQWPDGCGYSNDDEPCKSPLIAWIFAGIPSMTFLFSIIVNNLLIFCFVRSTVLRSYRHSTVRKINGTSIAAAQSSNQVMTSQLERVKAVGTQSFLYVAAFMISYVWAYAARILESNEYNASNSDVLYPLILLQTIFVPLQGFFNAFIFIRPDYLRIRKDFPREDRIWSLKRASWDPKIKPRHDKSFRGLRTDIHNGASNNTNTMDEQAKSNDDEGTIMQKSTDDNSSQQPGTSHDEVINGNAECKRDGESLNATNQDEKGKESYQFQPGEKDQKYLDVERSSNSFSVSMAIDIAEA